MVKNRHGRLLLDNEDSWFIEALYQQAANAVIRITSLDESVLFADKPRDFSIDFASKVIKNMASEKMKNLNTELVQIGNRYYVEITGDEAFIQQPLVPFKGFYNWLRKNGIHTSNTPVPVTPGDLYAVAIERKAFR